MQHCFSVIHHKMGYVNIDYHSFRHTHTTMLIESGVSPKAVQIRLGHKRIETTLNIYTHMTEKMQDKTKEFLDENLKLELNSKTAYFKQNQGINYCGFRIWKTHRLLREQSKKKMKRKLKNFQKLYKKDKIELPYITACINSWKGHAKHANSYNLVNKISEEFILTK